MEDVRILKYFKFVMPVLLIGIIVFLSLACKAPVIDDENGSNIQSEEVVSSSEEQTTSFYVKETESTEWVLDDIVLQTQEMSTDSRKNKFDEEEVNGVTFYKSNVSWMKGYLTSDEFLTICEVAGKLYRDYIDSSYSVSVRFPSNEEMELYENKYLYMITNEYKLKVHVYIVLKTGNDVVEEGVHELVVTYDVDHLVLDSGD